ncbi:hypothetical protein ACHAQH_010038, partial [Verticillium albo-atrum]
MRGNGFWDWMTSSDTGVEAASQTLSINEQAQGTLRRLPVVNFLDINDSKYIDALMEEALPHDRSRFRRYLSTSTLGLGMITAGPGFGKTTALAAATLAMQASLGNIYCSGPSNVSVDNFTARIDRLTRSICARYNQGKDENDPSRARHRMVIRGYKPRDESTAFMALVQKTMDGSRAETHRGLLRNSKWQLHLSVAYWLLVLLRSPSVDQLHPDDSKTLHALQKDFDGRAKIADLRAVVTGSMTWEDFCTASAGKKSPLPLLLDAVLASADLL